MVERPIGLISVEELVRVLPDLIADALRERDTRPPPSSQAILTKSTGVVVNADDTTAEVQLDDDEPGVLAQVQLANAVTPGDRVVVLMSPGGSAVAIGNGNAQAAAAASALPTDWIFLIYNSGQGSGLPQSYHAVEWDQVGFETWSHGSAIALTGGTGGTAITVSEDGWYTLDGYVFISGDGGSSGWSEASIDVEISRSFAIGADEQSDVSSFETFFPADENYANLPFGWVGYLMSGDTVGISVRLDRSDAGTFGVHDGVFRMEKLPM